MFQAKLDFLPSKISCDSYILLYYFCYSFYPILIIYHIQRNFNEKVKVFKKVIDIMLGFSSIMDLIKNFCSYHSVLIAIFSFSFYLLIFSFFIFLNKDERSIFRILAVLIIFHPVLLRIEII